MSAPTRVRSQIPYAPSPKHAKHARHRICPDRPGYTDTTEVREHLHQLNSWGMLYRSIAADAGMNEVSVRNIASAARSTSMRTRYALRLLAVTHTPSERQGIVLAIGAARRLRALQVLGHPLATFAEPTGMSVGTLWTIAYQYPATASTTYGKWLAIHDVYEEWSATPGTDPRIRKRHAGNPAPLDWEGVDINHPEAVPGEPRPVKLTRSQQSKILHATVFELLGEGMGVEEIARRLNVNQRTVERAIAEDRHAAAS